MLRIKSSKDLLLEVLRTSLRSENSTKSKSQMLKISKKMRVSPRMTINVIMWGLLSFC
jgi:hypothetical protein